MIAALQLAACASQKAAEPFYTRLYEGNFDEVWLATLKALNDYPLKLSNKDGGKIQSEVVNGPYNDLLFTYPDPISKFSAFGIPLSLILGSLRRTKNRWSVSV